MRYFEVDFIAPDGTGETHYYALPMEKYDDPEEDNLNIDAELCLAIDDDMWHFARRTCPRHHDLDQWWSESQWYWCEISEGKMIGG